MIAFWHRHLVAVARGPRGPAAERLIRYAARIAFTRSIFLLSSMQLPRRGLGGAASVGYARAGVFSAAPGRAAAAPSRTASSGFLSLRARVGVKGSGGMLPVPRGPRVRARRQDRGARGAPCRVQHNRRLQLTAAGCAVPGLGGRRPGLRCRLGTRSCLSRRTGQGASRASAAEPPIR